jgi:uncharacterized RDD family membrane protein YckC
MEQEEESIIPEADIVFAKFGSRFGASLIDGIIIILVNLPITYFNVTQWKIPAVYILTSLILICYKPFLEYRYGATLGKMALGIIVVGYQFQKVTLREELRRVSFYLVPNIIQEIMTLKIYFSGDLKLIGSYTEYSNYVTTSNPALFILNLIVFVLLVADCIVFLSDGQNQSLHDKYAGTFVIEKPAATM